MELLKEWKPITHDALGREIDEHKHLTNYECCIDANQVVHLRNKKRKGNRNKELKQILCSHGYYVFQPRQGKLKSNIKVHRLVALLWKENPDNKPCVDHEDQDKLNNKLSNLRWCTKSENNMNRGLYSHNTSGEQCIYEIFHHGKPVWRVIVRTKGKKPLQKYFKRDPNSNVIPPEVIAWRDAAKKKQHGEFACIIPRLPSSESSAEP